jgi:hypothetical protein
MLPKIVRIFLSIALALALALGLYLPDGLPGRGISPAQEAAALHQQWIQAFSPFTGSAANAAIGSALAENTTGTVIVIGASAETVGGAVGQGAAYVYMGSNALGWTSYPLHTSDGAAGAHFGNAVAVSGDGSTLLVTAQGYTLNHLNRGAAYPFARTGTNWAPQTLNPLLAFGAADNDLLGISAALSGDGNTALVSAPGRAANRGTAHVYARTGISWAYQHEIDAWDGLGGDDFGRSVALSSDGNTALLFNAQDKDNTRGGVYFFAYNPNYPAYVPVTRH